MTDEQYIDELFAREDVGMDTPGFRDFVLDLMGMIGEQPRAGDVCSMHLAYRAGMEQSQRETPADPFAKTDPMRTDQDGRAYNHDDREAKLRPELLVQKAIQHLRKRKPRNGRGYVYPLWKRVADLFGLGSGYSAEICRRYGFDPDEQWMNEKPIL